MGEEQRPPPRPRCGGLLEDSSDVFSVRHGLKPRRE